MMIQSGTIARCAVASMLIAVQAHAEQVSATSAAQLTADTQALTISNQGSEGGGHRLSITLTSLDNAGATSGTANVVGFPVVLSGSFGDIDWHVDGASVTGSLKNVEGAVEGTFLGTITATGVSGTFTTGDGRTGLWSWDGPLPGQTP